MSLIARSSARTSFYHNSIPFSKLFGEQTRALLAGRRDWGPDHLARGIWEPGVARTSQAKRPGPPRARQLGAQSFEDVSGETGWTTSRAAPRSSDLRGCLRRNAQSRTTQKRELRGCLRRNGPDHQILLRMSQAKRQIPDNSETTVARMSQAKRADHLARGSSELRFARMSQAKRSIPEHSETRVVRMSQANRPGPPGFCEDVSACAVLGRN